MAAEVHKVARAVSGHASWSVFAAAEPALAETGRELLYRGAPIANAFLATVAPDGGPRLHPVCPVLANGELWLFVVNMSPKYRDLVRNGRYALHAMPLPQGGEEFYIRGAVTEVADPATRAEITAATAGRQGTLEFEALFRCTLQSVLHTRWENWGTPQTWPTYTKWRA